MPRNSHISPRPSHISPTGVRGEIEGWYVSRGHDMRADMWKPCNSPCIPWNWGEAQGYGISYHLDWGSLDSKRVWRTLFAYQGHDTGAWYEGTIWGHNTRCILRAWYGAWCMASYRDTSHVSNHTQHIAMPNNKVLCTCTFHPLLHREPQHVLPNDQSLSRLARRVSLW